ncbi:MAG: hypothetical protein QOH69_1575 [Actinomycetota bacterium]|jgi:glycosyltransferase involved in cell wall biosynthesis|nr:hypothetical protein [Actinomycetota bacterium]MDQ1551789.1 hypothetical protein [Actinomycetota bacterium]
MTVLASILIPTHDHASTLPLTVASALHQTVSDIEVVLIGDGVTPEVRAVAENLVASDGRVRFLDYPKGANHGEVYRDTAIRDASSDAIFYLCDDDLLMPDHVADLLELLKGHNFVQSKNGFFTTDGKVAPHPGDLSDPAAIAQHLRTDLVFSFVSLTGTAHSRQFYLDAAEPWTLTPAGIFPDIYQWRKLMRNPTFVGATSKRMTALQFPTSQAGRDTWTAQERLAEIEKWAILAATPEGQIRIDSLVAEGDRETLIRDQERLFDLELRLIELELWKRRRGQVLADRFTRFVYRLPVVNRALGRSR